MTGWFEYGDQIRRAANGAGNKAGSSAKWRSDHSVNAEMREQKGGERPDHQKNDGASPDNSGKVVLTVNKKIVARINAYFPDRNYGFLHQNKDGVVVKHFLHINNIVAGVPARGLMARFDSVMGEKGSIAVNVEILDEVKS